MSKYEDALALLRRERDDELKRAAAATLDEEDARAQMDYAESHTHDHVGADIQLYMERRETAARDRKAAEERAGRLSAAIEKLESSDE
jgi:hypothetical protein